MPEDHVENLRKNMIAIGRLLWEKDLASVLNGNISTRVDVERILLTATKTCLGLLQEKDILLINLDGQVLEEGQVSTEKLLHLEIYRNFPQVSAVIHTHTTFINAYFLSQDTLHPEIFETRLHLGKVEAVCQDTPTVTDAHPVIEALGKNNLMVLKNHGVLAMGKDLFECFLLIQSLEDAVKVDAISRLYQCAPVSEKDSGQVPAKGKTEKGKTYSLFSRDQMDAIVRCVNRDKAMQEIGVKTKMTMDLAIQLDETRQVFSFHFKDGHIERVGEDKDAEFLISAPEAVWRAVFQGELDPFVATTQKKMILKGDFSRISKWYAPCNRIFELWKEVPLTP